MVDEREIHIRPRSKLAEVYTLLTDQFQTPFHFFGVNVVPFEEAVEGPLLE